jgi:RNA polymerase sigma-70 factor (ECF subfamily)
MTDTSAPRVGGGAQERLKEMFESHHETVWRFLCRNGFDAEVAADMAQQAFLIAGERLNDIRPGCERAFLLETGLRLSRAARRKTNRMQFGEDMDLRMTSTMSADEALDRRRAIDVLDRVLTALTGDLLEVFVLFELERVSMRDIAEMLNIPTGTVASRLRRARESFRIEAARIERAILDRRQS